MKRTLNYRASLFFLFITLCAFAQDTITGKVVSVTDGDTVGVLVNQQEVKIRLHGIDCPEGGQNFGTRAKQFTSDLVFGKIVQVTVKDTDRYGRTVGVVTTEDGNSLNDELLKAGLAWWYREYAPNEKNLAVLQATAMMQNRGLWSQSNPIPPWAFRKGDTPEYRVIVPPPAAPKSAENALSLPTQPRTAPQVYEDTETLRGASGAGARMAQGEVYVTNTGAKYHRDGCRYLKASRIPSTLADAQAQAYQPCKVCYGESAPIEIRSKGNFKREPMPVYQPQAAPQVQDGQHVYITNTGNKYHMYGCQYLSQSKIPISLEDARRSYGACSVCRP